MDHINFVNRIDELLTNFKAEDLTDILKWQKDLFLELNS